MTLNQKGANMAKQENVTDASQVKQANFRKLFGDAPEMHEPAAKETVARFLQTRKEPFHLFAVPREYPLCDPRNVPGILLEKKFTFTANPNEFFVFQIVLWSPKQGLGNIRLNAADVPFPWRCFNLREGKRLNMNSHSLQALWVGMEIPRTASGTFRLKFQVETENFPSETIELPLEISGDALNDGGESDDCRMARLRWLDSDIGSADTVFPPYLPVRRNGRVLTWLGHSIELGNNGLPRRIASFYHGDNTAIGDRPVELLSGPVAFTTRSGDSFEGELTFTQEKEIGIRWEGSGAVGDIPAVVKGSLEFDGTIRFHLSLFPERCGTESFRLALNHAPHDFFMGLDRHGGPCPDRLDWYWNREFWQDGYWIGSLNAGMKVRLFDEKSIPPLVNAYYEFSPLHLPERWHNNGNGGISLKKTESSVQAELFSGEMEFEQNETLNFFFEFQITPFHPAERNRFFGEHFYHPHMHAFTIGGPDPLEELDLDTLRREGVTCVNVHHAVGINPIINYPFTSLSLPKLADFVEKVHRKGLKVIFYYTIRELTVHCPEFWAFRSLGDEIFFPGAGQESRPCTNSSAPHEWLCKNLGSGFLPAWAEVIKNGPAAGNLDLALETTPGGRLENFYLEGLRYLLERVPLDGLYLDDSSLSAEGFRRTIRIFRQYRGCAPIIDFHGWNPFPFNGKRNFGRCSILYRDMNNLPYFSDLWLGEAFDYEAASPEYYLTEISGLPFGLTGQMLQRGGNPWRGLLFGMTSRYGWQGDPRNLWDFFKRFGTDGLKIESDFEKPLFRTEDSQVRMTRFSNSAGKYCLALASWNPEETWITLNEEFSAPEIPDFQNAANFAPGERIPIAPGKGLILLPVRQ